MKTLIKTLTKKVIKASLFLLALLSCTIAVDAQELVSGSVIGRHIYGLAIDYQGDPVLIEDRPIIYKKSSFDQVINIEKSSFVISAFDDGIGSLYVTKIDSKTQSNVDTVALELESINGLNHPVAGIKTAWNSVLFTESNSINAAYPDEFINQFKPFYKGNTNLINPYNYGWVSEVVVLDSKGLAKAIKNFAVGRLFANQIILMPDGKAVYLLDSTGNLYLFIADQANSLAKGELYVINRQQGQIKHTLLGKPSALKVKFKLKKMTFDALFQTKEPKNQSCIKNFKYIKTIYGEECLKINPKNKKYTAIFEPVRAMALQGISSFTTERSRMHFNTASNQLVIEQADQTRISLNLGQNLGQKLNSQYTIKDPQ